MFFQTRSFILLLACLYSFSLVTNMSIEKIKRKLDAYLLDKKHDVSKLRTVLESGSMNGHFKSKELYDLFFYLQKKYPQFVSTNKIGSTVEHRDIFAFKLQKPSPNGKSITKSKILFTGAHHARELLTATIVLKIFVESLHSLLYNTANSTFWIFNDLIIVPLVNLDSHTYISDAFGTEDWDDHKYKRKNMNRSYCPSDTTNGGVDLNRNYGYHYGETTEDLEECSETYRGPTSFSEPETQAVRSLIEKEKTIASAMNFHCYGNIWIHPFNYMHTPDKYPENAYQDIIDFYEEFRHEVAKVSAAKYGNAIETVEYATDGEGSDWMLGEHKIVAFSPELGSFNPKAQTFFLPKDLIYEVIQENYKVIDLFIKRNNFELRDPVYGVNSHNEFTITFTNRGLANIFKPRIMLTSDNSKLLQSITHVITHGEDGSRVHIDVKSGLTHKINGFDFEVDKIGRLDEFTMSFKVSDPSLLRSAINLNLEIIMADGTSISKLDVVFDNSVFGGYVTVTLLALVSLFLLMLVVFGLRLMRKVSSKGTDNNVIDKPIIGIDQISQQQL